MCADKATANSLSLPTWILFLNKVQLCKERELAFALSAHLKR